jgi:hypothetical protein
VKPRVWKVLALALQGRHSCCTVLTGLISRVLFPGLAPWALLRRAFGAPDYPGCKKYGHEKKSKIQHFCARKLLKTLDRFFAKSIFSRDLCGVRRLAGRAKAQPYSCLRTEIFCITNTGYRFYRDGGAPGCAGRNELLIYPKLISAILRNVHYKSCQDCFQIYFFLRDTPHSCWTEGLGDLITIQGTI